MRTLLLVALLSFAAWGFAAAPPVVVSAPAPEPSLPPDPVCLGWDGGWVVYRYSLSGGKWSTWKGPDAALPRIKAFCAIGADAVAVVDPARRYSGWLSDLRSCKWMEIPPSPIAGPDIIWDPIVVAFAGDRLVLWGRSRGPINGALLDTRTMKWDAMPKAPVRLRFRALRVAIGRKVVVWGGFGEGEPDCLQDGAVFDTTKNTWKKMADAPVKFCYGTSCEVWRGRFVGHGSKQARPG